MARVTERWVLREKWFAALLISLFVLGGLQCKKSLTTFQPAHGMYALQLTKTLAQIPSERLCCDVIYYYGTNQARILFLKLNNIALLLD